MNNSDNSIIVKDIILNESLNIVLQMNDLDNIKLMNNKALNYSYKIYEDDDNQFKVLYCAIALNYIIVLKSLFF